MNAPAKITHRWDAKSGVSRELVEILESCAGRWPGNTQVNIEWGVTRAVNADIRSVGPEGITRYFSRSCETIPWDEIEVIEAIALDPKTGNYLARRRFALRDKEKAA